MKHSRLAPSASNRWSTCTASIQFIESLKLPPGDDDEYAKEGTEAHRVFATALGLDNPFDVEFETFEQAEHLPQAIEYVENIQARHPEAEVHREIRVNPQKFVRTVHCKGTADVIIPVDMDVLYVIDLKFGVHVVVDVEDNTQLILYALGSLAKFEALGYEFKEVVLTILQPRAWHPEGPIREWRVSRNKLVRWGRRLGRKAREALGPVPVFRPTPEDACRFCPAAGVCRALAEYELKAARKVFTTVADTEAEFKGDEELMPHEVSFLLKEFPAMRRWMSKVSGMALSRMENGGHIPYFGLKDKLSYRKWAEESETLEILFDEDTLYERVLRSPAQVEKRAGKHSVDGLTERKVTGSTIIETNDADDADEPNPFKVIE